ncbi:MAG TPA: hypothetical protein DCZ91_01105 [Lachnospiraceae bacterium]|nr:hypothetical protein [Lachnospiraceae bacterium]
MDKREKYVFQTVIPGEAKVLGNYGDRDYQITDRYLIKNGKPWLPSSGELHYSRLHRDLWDRELDKMKEAGIDIVSTYIFWIHHEEIQGEFHWDGNLNLGEFIDLCHEKGLEVSLRIGPWVHGECRNGGFPDWLLQQCGEKVRCNAEPYMTYVRQYYERIAEHLNGRKLFSIQIENELVFDAAHLESLYDLARECGFEAGFFTATAWGADMRQLYHKMLPTYGGYPEQPWNPGTGKSWPNPHFFFTGVRSDSYIGNDLLPMKDVIQDESVPYLTCEVGPGVLPYDHRRPRISAEDVLSMAVDTLGDGCNLLGFYVFHGGSNPLGKLSTMQESKETNYPNDCPVISYDFQAPIGEAGYRRESYYRLQSVLRFLQHYGEKLAPMVSVYPDCRPKGLEDTETLRCCMRSDGEEGFLFINNHHHGKQLPEHRDVRFLIQFREHTAEINCPVIPTDATFLMPVRMKLSDTVRLEYAFVQPVSREGKNYYFEEIGGMEPLFRFADGQELVVRDSAAVGDVVIHVRPRRHPEEKEGKQLTFQAMGKDCWRIENVPKAACRMRFCYYGDHICVYTQKTAGEPCWKDLIADHFYYGDFLEFYKPEGITGLEVRIQPLLPEKEVYLECERKNGAGLEAVLYLDTD